MTRFFSVPLALGILVAFIWPFQSLALSGFSSAILFVQLFLNTLTLDKGNLDRIKRDEWGALFLLQILIFLFLPVVFAFAAGFLIRDLDLAFGLTLTVLAPCAFVNPFFASLRGGDIRLSMMNVAFSTLLFPVVAIPLARALSPVSLFASADFILMIMLAVIPLPIALGLAVSRWLPGLRQKLVAGIGPANSLLLGALMFLLVGPALLRLPVRMFFTGEMAGVVAALVLFDFGLYQLARFVGVRVTAPPKAEAAAISLATRNFALVGAVLLIFHPKAALVPALGLVVHVFFFQYLAAGGRTQQKVF